MSAATQLSLPEIVYRELRNAILNGVYLPGDMLRQDDVAAKLGVSRNPLREALPRLEADGIVVLYPRRGYAVATLDASEIEEVFSLRMLIETNLARRSVQRRGASDIARVRQILGEMSEVASQADGADRAKWFELNQQFHDALLQSARRPHHMRALGLSRGVLEAYIRAEVRLTGDLDQAQREHAIMASAFVKGDADELERLLRIHSTHTRDRLLTGLAGQIFDETAGRSSAVDQASVNSF